ncbi:MAG TPA: hypothetical protein VGY48_15495 [Vicinamibacterales bacterium]|jgi:hypothetical protein|nr:hypothetical protein [Vicinamibacterales bacterium]
MTARDIAELYVEELTAHPAKHGLDLWLSRGFSFNRRAVQPIGPRGPNPSTSHSPTRGRVQPGSRLLKQRVNSRANVLADSLTGVRAIVADMRRRGASAVEVQRYIVTQTPFTLRSVFRAPTDAFERVCYVAAL